MSILITTPIQLDVITASCELFILKIVVTNIPDYNKEAKLNLQEVSYKLADKAFRSIPLEGMLMLFKKRHGIVLPPKSDFYIVNDGDTPQEAMSLWSALQTEPLDQNPVRFVTDHLAYYADFNNGLFYQLLNSSLTLTNIPLV